MTTLKELLRVPRFSDLVVLNNDDKLDIPVSSVEITETPDVALYIPKDVLILSTAMVFKDNQSDLIPFIKSLVDSQAAGLAIKMNRFLNELDPEVVAYANEHNFPIINIPGFYSLGSLLHQLQNYLWDTKEEEINYAMDIQKTFSALLMNDANINYFTNELGKIIKTPVLLLNPFYKTIAYSRHFQHSRNSATHVAEEIWNHYQDIHTETDNFLIKKSENKSQHVAVYPIKVFNYFPHYLIILEPEKIPYPISSFAIEQAALVLSFILFKNLKVTESQQNLQNEILEKFIENNAAPLTQANAKLLEVGTPLRLFDSSHNQIIFIQFVDTEKTEQRVKYNGEKKQLVLQWFQNYLKDVLPHPSVLYPSHNNNIIFLLQNKMVNIEEILEQLAIELETILPITVKFYFGGIYESLDKISDSFIEAELAQKTIKQMTEVPRMNYFRPQGLKQLFRQDDRETIFYFTTSILKDLAYPKEESLIELQKTLRNYLDNQSQITKTAQAMFIHRNTVKYRIERCEEILGQKLTDPTVSLNVRLALELINMD